MKEKILILGSSSFSGASLVNFLLNKKKYLVFGTYRRKKIKQFLPYSYNQNIKFFNEIQVDFLGNPQKIINSKARVDINKILNRVKSEKKFNKHKNFIIYIIVTFTVAALALFLSN